MATKRLRNWALGAACVVGLSACHPITGCGIGPLSVGMPQDQAQQAGFEFTTAFESQGLDDCGTYESKRPNDDHLLGLGYDRVISWVQTDNPTDTLTNGLGPGSTYAEIQAVYGSDAVVHFPSNDPYDNVALYVPVVVVKVGSNAINFEMKSEALAANGRLKGSTIAEYVKVSTWAARGDDEGCA